MSINPKRINTYDQYYENLNIYEKSYDFVTFWVFDERFAMTQCTDNALILRFHKITFFYFSIGRETRKKHKFPIIIKLKKMAINPVCDNGDRHFCSVTKCDKKCNFLISFHPGKFYTSVVS